MATKATKTPAKLLTIQSRVRPAAKFPFCTDATPVDASTQTGTVKGKKLTGRAYTEAYVKEFERLNTLVLVPLGAPPVVAADVAELAEDLV